MMLNTKFFVLNKHTYPDAAYVGMFNYWVIVLVIQVIYRYLETKQLPLQSNTILRDTLNSHSISCYSVTCLVLSA